MPSLSVLVVEDYEPFRRFICSMLAKRPELLVVGEASDGFEAVQKAEALRPDLIVIDIGLPTLNGIEAARRIRRLSSESKILLVSQESSADVVHEALALGALGYVVKARAGSELLPAVAAVIEGREFVGSGLSGHYFASAPDSNHSDRPSHGGVLPHLPQKADTSRSHEVEFYSDDAAFVVGFARFIQAGLTAGSAVIVVAAESHREGILQRLRETGADITVAIEQGRYIFVDVVDALAAFMENDLPDPVGFFRVAGDLIAPAARATLSRKVAICGECASILWAQGKADAAFQVEQLCNQLARRYELDILCGFSLSSSYREKDKQIFQKICRE